MGSTRRSLAASDLYTKSVPFSFIVPITDVQSALNPNSTRFPVVLLHANTFSLRSGLFLGKIILI